MADCHLDELTSRDFDAMVVPGGLPGSEVIRDTPLAIDLLREQAALGRWRAAICAAPAVVLHHHGLLGDASVTCHPGFQARLPAAQLSTARVVRDDAHRLITSQGPGTAIEFALELVRVLRGDEAARAVAGPMVLPPRSCHNRTKHSPWNDRAPLPTGKGALLWTAASPCHPADKQRCQPF